MCGEYRVYTGGDLALEESFRLYPAKFGEVRLVMHYGVAPHLSQWKVIRLL